MVGRGSTVGPGIERAPEPGWNSDVWNVETLSGSEMELSR
jgi:hypothetical protein